MTRNDPARRSRKLRVIIAVIVVALISIYAFASVRKFSGRVVEEKTGKPIEGAVVVAVWRSERATIAGPSDTVKDVKETLTDSNGEWRIRGPRGSGPGPINAIFTFVTGTSYTREPIFIIYKPGYCSWPDGFGIEACKWMHPGGNGAIIEGTTIKLPALTDREDRRRATPSPAGFDNKLYSKQKMLIGAIREEWKYLYSEEPPDDYYSH